MEINITQFYTSVDPADFAASIAEIGENAAQITWQAAKDADFNFMDTPERIASMRAWVKSTGAWPDGLPDADLNPLFIQLISGDIREKQDHCDTWSEYYELAEAGQVIGDLYESGHQIYYRLEG